MGRKKLTATVALALAAMSLRETWAEQAVQKGDRIEVTGSRLTSSDADSASPIAVIKAEDIRIEGYQQLELLLNNLPQVSDGQGNRVNNGATGTANVILRGLGTQRTLTLVNGRRMPAGSPFNLAPDINQIPPTLIQRIELLTGGASAVYGSDAIAGVVNFIMNDRFEGVQGDVAYDFYNHQQGHAFMQGLLRARNYAIPSDKSADGATTAVTLTVGSNFAQDRGNAVVSFRYLNTDPLMQSDRDYSACTLAPDMTRPGVMACGGSNTSFAGRFTDIRAPRRPGEDHRPWWTMDLNSGAVRPYLIPGDQYNYAPLNYFQRPAERYGFNAYANYDLTPDARVYAEFGYMDDNTVFQLAPSGVFGNLTTVRYENPLLTEDWRRNLRFLRPDGTVGTGPGTVASVVIERRNVEGGGRQGQIRSTSFREVIGLKGTLARDWDYDTYFQASAARTDIIQTADFSTTRLRRALDVVVDPATGRAACASAVNGTDPACVPYNPWTLTGVTQDALAYVQIPGVEQARTTQQIIGGTMTTDLGRYGLKFPRARTGVEVAVGVERRSESLDYQPDAAMMAGELAGNVTASLPVKGSIVTKDLFGEVRIPVLDALNFSGSYRYSDPGGGKETNTYGVGFNAQPLGALRIRGSYQRAIRNPNLNELFEVQRGSFADLEVDPCAGPTPAASFAQCQRTGVTLAQYGNIEPAPIGYSSVIGGNPALAAEKGTTYTLGVVLSPIRNATVTVDYWDITIDDAILNVSTTVTMEQCIETGDPKFCSWVRRDPLLGSLWLNGGYILDVQQNVGAIRMSGMDIAASYSAKLGQGHALLFDGIGTYVRNLSFQEYPGAAETKCAGYFGQFCGPATPRWRHRLRTTWQTPWSLDLAGTWRYTSEVKHVASSYTPLIKAMSYFDLAASWNMSKRVTLRAGVNNLFDEDPPLVLGASGNTPAHAYDALGRHVFMSVTARF